MDGYIGYVQKDTIASAETKDFERDLKTESYTYLTMDGKSKYELASGDKSGCKCISGGHDRKCQRVKM